MDPVVFIITLPTQPLIAQVYRPECPQLFYLESRLEQPLWSTVLCSNSLLCKAVVGDRVEGVGESSTLCSVVCELE